MKDLIALEDIMPHLVKEASHVILRNDFTSGQRQHQANELGANPNKPWQQDMTGTPQPHYGDPTGEEACWEEMPDRTGQAITALCEMLNKALNSALTIHDLSNTDVRIRATKTMPDCLACGKPILDKVLSGYDRKCYDRWVYLGRPDRVRFQMEQMALQQDEVVTSDKDSNQQ